TERLNAVSSAEFTISSRSFRAAFKRPAPNPLQRIDNNPRGEPNDVLSAVCPSGRAPPRLYAGRVARGDRDHRRAGLAAAASRADGTRSGPPHGLPEQSASAGAGAAQSRKRVWPVPIGRRRHRLEPKPAG